MKATLRYLSGLLTLLLIINSVNAQYTETMDPDGLTKNMKDDYGLVDDNAASEQSYKLQNAISDINALGGGRIIIPKGTYSLASITLMSNVHILIEAGTVIIPAQGNKVVFRFDTETGKGQGFIENVSVRGIEGSFIVDYHTRVAGVKQRAIIAKMVRNFLISDMDVKDNYSTHCGITLTVTSESGDISDWEVTRATDGTVRNIRHFRASPGYGLVQCHGAQSVYFENLYSVGGVALRLESGADYMHVGLYDLTAKNITCVNGRAAVMLGPHSAKNGIVTVDSVKAISCSYAVTFGDGGVKEGAPDQTPGYFSDSSSVSNIHAIFGNYSQVKGSKFLAIPTTDYYEDMKMFSDNKFFDAPSIGGVFDGASTYTINIENVTLEGFEYNNDKAILTDADNRPGKWGTEKTNWINTHQGAQWETVKGVVVKGYNIEDYVNSSAPIISPDTLRSSTNEDEAVFVSLTGMVSDPDVDPLPVTSISGPGNGSIVISGSNITYSPDPGFFGSDTIVYKVCDYETPSLCTEGSIIVEISSVNDAPVISNTTNFFEVKKDTSSFTIPVSDSLVSDPDGDSLIITIDKDPGNGSALVDQAGNITYIPDPGFEGTDTILFSACDTGSPILCVSGIIILEVESDSQDTVSTDTELLNRNNITVYPNPADNVIFIEGEVLINKVINLSMFDLAGREVYHRENLPSAGNTITLNIPQLSMGYYSLKITTEQGEVIAFSKVMVQ